MHESVRVFDEYVWHICHESTSPAAVKEDLA